MEKNILYKMSIIFGYLKKSSKLFLFEFQKISREKHLKKYYLILNYFHSNFGEWKKLFFFRTGVIYINLNFFYYFELFIKKSYYYFELFVFPVQKMA